MYVRNNGKFSFIAIIAGGLILAGAVQCAISGEAEEGNGHGYFSFYAAAYPPTGPTGTFANGNTLSYSGAMDGQVSPPSLFLNDSWGDEPQSNPPGQGLNLLGSFSSFSSPGAGTLDCYRDPIFDGNKSVPNEPASVSDDQVDFNSAIPEPLGILMLATGAALILRNRRGLLRG
jgi:hypothetical protein